MNTKNLTIDVIRGERWVGLWTVAMWVFTLLGFFCVVSFLTAQHPEDIASARVMVPSTWPAAVRNHGHYYLWWTVSQKPLCFAISLAMVLYGPVTVIRNIRRRGAMHQQPPPSLCTRVAVASVLFSGIAALSVTVLDIVVGINVFGWPTTY